MIFKLLRERLSNYPGRALVNRTLKQFRRSFLDALPRGTPTVTVLESQPAWDRWAGLDPSRYPETARRTGGDRPTRLAQLRQFEGRLTLDPLSLNLFDDRRIVWGSYDGIGREREPALSSFLLRANHDLGEFVSLRGAFENNYFHFLYDFMPKLMLIERHVPRGTPLVVGETLLAQPFFRDAQRMGVFEGHVIIGQGKRTRVGGERVFVPSPVEPTRDDLLAIARRFGAPERLSRPGQRLYVARGLKAANKRRLVNEGALFAALEPYGFTFFDPQEHDLATQIDRFAHAEAIVSPHGAALTNLIWRAGRPLMVWELVNPSMHTLDMAHISAQLGYEHRILENHGDRGQPVRSSAWADIDAVLNSVEARLGPAHGIRSAA
jgi:hypothetical protein